MKLNIFYSWQSDLPNNKNRGLINDSINDAMKNVFKNNKNISEYNIESDSRNEVGTPDLMTSIFSKIDICDIFICDISIVNTCNLPITEKQIRKMPNPNVMVELGYASKSIGWSNIICIFNKEFARIEDLPFDIRFRKPLAYNTSFDKLEQKKQLTRLLEQTILDIINTRILDKQQYVKTKRQVDLGMQAILIDFCKMLYKEDSDRYNYNLLLNSTKDDIYNIVKNETYLGFELFKNVILNINEFAEFFRDDINTYFLSENEKKLIVKMIYTLRDYKELLNVKNLSEQEYDKSQYKIISGFEMNPNNPKNSYILLKIISDQKGVVLDS